MSSVAEQARAVAESSGSLRVCKMAVTGHDGVEMFVERAASDLVRVQWFCGDEKTLSFANLEQIVANVEGMKAFPDVWVTHEDHTGGKFVTRLEDGFLFADYQPSTRDRCVEWAALRKALKKVQE